MVLCFSSAPKLILTYLPIAVFDSPQVDMGYDVSDYRAIYPPYGTVEHVEQLIAGLHDRNMRLLLDLVVNHTSDQVGKPFYFLTLLFSSGCWAHTYKS